MRRATIGALVFVLLATVFGVAQKADKPAAKLPKLVTDARYVYVTSYEGRAGSTDISRENLQAVATVQDALRAWGRYKLVTRPKEADLLILVNSGRSYGLGPSDPEARANRKNVAEDEFAVYDADAGFDSPPLWRGLVVDGLVGTNPPLVRQFRAAVEGTTVD